MLPREIETEHWPDRTSYDFPVRPIGKWRLSGLFLIGFALLFASGPVKGALQFLQRIENGQGHGFDWIAIATGCFFAAAAIVPFGLGLFVLAGRTRLVVSQDRITATEIAGPVRWRRRINVADVVRLEIASGMGQPADDRPQPKSLERFAALTAIQPSAKKLLLVVGYPREWLEAVAQEISSTMRSSGVTVAVSHVSATATGDAIAEVTEKPVGSEITIEPRVNGILVVIPPAGLRKGSKGMLPMGIFWCLFMGLFTCVTFFTGKGAHEVPWAVCVFIAGFWLIGLGLLAGAINMGRRRATISVENGELRLEQHGPFGIKHCQWRRGEIASIQAGPSGMKVNHVPVIELQIHPATGKKAGFFSGRSDVELGWIATELRRALSVPAARPAGSLTG